MADAHSVHSINSVEEFDKLAQETQPVFVDFHAEWCGPCKASGPVIDKLAEKLGDQMKFVKVDVDDFNDLAAKYDVRAIPTMITLHKGEVIGRETGYRGEPALQAMIDTTLQSVTKAA